ncbi:Kinase domain protein [Aphelenchoides fujianensis]|nr:Kinase domain protein [Aphelenchoides fujianensis]
MPELTEYVFQLPALAVADLAQNLDPEGAWEEVARAMPGINLIDIDGCRRSLKPTEALIRIWGSKGYKTLDLFKVFGRVRYVTCMRLLHPYIDEQYHAYTDSVVQKKPVLSPRIPPANDAHSVGRFSEHTQPSTVYSKKATSHSELQFLSEGEAAHASSDIFTGLQNTPVVKYEDIRAATKDFAQEQICGKGGYGVVYRGVWQHTEVAIKRIRTPKDGSGAQNKERIRQSLQELRHLSKLRHDNILCLYAYSMDGQEPCLIYQFMSNGSLEDRMLCRGTLAYLPPEFTRSKILTTKLDVYSFGVVLLEVATGLRAYSDARQPHSLVAYVNKLTNEKKRAEIAEALGDKRVEMNEEGRKIFDLLLTPRRQTGSSGQRSP